MDIQVYQKYKAININVSFNFSTAVPPGLEKEFKILNCSNVESFQNSFAKCSKEVSNMCSLTLWRSWNEALVIMKIFSQNLKLVDITPIHKKEDLKLVKHWNFETGISNFTDDATLCVGDQAIKTVLETLERNSEIVIIWLEMNYKKSDNNKCYLLISGSRYGKMWAEIGENKVWGTSCYKLAGVNNWRKTYFDHMDDLCLKTNQKLCVLYFTLH